MACTPQHIMCTFKGKLQASHPQSCIESSLVLAFMLCKPRSLPTEPKSILEHAPYEPQKAPSGIMYWRSSRGINQPSLLGSLDEHGTMYQLLSAIAPPCPVGVCPGPALNGELSCRSTPSWGGHQWGAHHVRGGEVACEHERAAGKSSSHWYTARIIVSPSSCHSTGFPTPANSWCAFYFD